MAVILETSLGEITIDLYCDERPRCCENFLKLCKIKYYNFCAFHSVQRNLVAQTGDPTDTGRAGESIFAKLYGEQAKFFDAENKPRISHKKMGTVSMVNNGNNMHGSQFFLTLAADIDYLDGKHSVFGEVAEGIDTLKKINEAFTDDEHRPYKDIRIYHTVVLDDPFDDPQGLSEFIPDASPEPTKQQLESVRIGAEEEIDDTIGKTAEEIDEVLQQKEAKANAQILEMVGDLPSVDVNPEDNVLFVCKLNPVTTSEDLEIIFSRFGNILSCEVIKDHKTEESLQYAFIEFEKACECENAYFKMDNVLIDDRRIHVDFSQSVAKLHKRPGGQGSFGDKQQYVIKDQLRRDKYDYVFSDEETEVRKERKGEKTKVSKTDERNKAQRNHKGKTSSHNNEKSSRPRHKSRSRSRERLIADGKRSRSKERLTRDRKRSRSKERLTQDRKRSRSKERLTANHKRSRSKERLTGDRKRSRSKERLTRDRKRSRSKDRQSEVRHRQHKEDDYVKSKSYKSLKSHRNYHESRHDGHH